MPEDGSSLVRAYKATPAAGDTYDVLGDTAAARNAWRNALAVLEQLHEPDAERIRAKLGDLDARLD